MAGEAFLLKIKTDDGYQTVAGLRTSMLSINGDPVQITHRQSTGWRHLLDGAGVRSVSVGAAGIFLGSQAENTIRTHALSGTLAEYELSFENGRKMRGIFLVQRLDYSGEFSGERNYTIQLESSGRVESI